MTFVISLPPSSHQLLRKLKAIDHETALERHTSQAVSPGIQIARDVDDEIRQQRN